MPSDKPGKWDKIPCDPRTGHGCKLTDPAVWSDYATAAAGVSRADRGHGGGVGFVFSEADPFWFLDIDGARQGDAWSPLAVSLYQALPGAAWEVSQSGQGLHAFGSGTLPEHRCKNIPLGLELYHKERFVALTLNTWPGGAADAHCPAMSALVEQYFAPLAAAAGALDDWTSEPIAEWNGPTDDNDLIRRARAARSVTSLFARPDGSAAAVAFADLWDASPEPLAARWPGNGASGYDASAADGALAAHLAFWTGKDCERIERLMRASGLQRDKWDRASAYLTPTIMRACNAVARVCVDAERAAPAAVPLEAQLAVDAGEQFGPYVPPMAYPAYFTNCAYVISAKAIYTPQHGLLEATSFDTVYGGGRKFILDDAGTKITDSAWEAFRMCPTYATPIANTLCFRPELPVSALIIDEGRTLLNTYVPIETYAVAGDASPFLDLLARMLPVQSDREIVLSYMAALVQNPGRKFQWWPVFQGAEGNGKTTLLSVMSHAIGHRYTHLVNPEAMANTGNQFNKWVTGHLFVGLEEIYMPKRRDFLESFKATVTNSRLAMEGKGSDQATADNRINGMMLTNHTDAIPVNLNSRRYAIFFMAQQSYADIVRDGMGGDYFPLFYDWLNGVGAWESYGPRYGLAVVNAYLRAYVPVAAYNPAGLCQRAPVTSSWGDALAISSGMVEQEVQEAIDEGRPGFAGGWVSSHYLGVLLDKLRVRIPHLKRKEMMHGLGYVPHPGLPDGRSTSVVAPDGCKSRLYVREGHLSCGLEDGASICKAYSKAQTIVVGEDAAARFAPRA